MALVRNIFICLTAIILMSGCGSDSKSGGGGGASYFNLTGSITSQSGGQAEMAGWYVVLMNSNSQMSIIGEVDASGQFKMKQIDNSRTYSLLLLNPEFKYSGSLSMPCTTATSLPGCTAEKTTMQWFKFRGTTLPRLVQKGKIIAFQSYDEIEIVANAAKDTDNDGVADGPASVTLVEVDSDVDGVPNSLDPDIDADGLPNVVDTDDDGDGIADVFDSDANGDLTADSLQSTGDHYFSEVVKFFATQYEITSGSSQAVLKLSSTMRSEVGIPTAVSLRGSSVTFNGSTVDGSAWDRTLADDGRNEDSGASDGTWGRKVTLASGKGPKSFELMFLQVKFGEGDAAYYYEFPYTFPAITVGDISTAYDSATRIVTISGTPFGTGNTGYTWYVNVFNSEGSRVFTSNAISGTTSTYTIPSSATTSGSSYQYNVTAQLMDTVPGVPSIVLTSGKGSL